MAEVIERAKSEQYTIFDFDIGDLVLSITSLNFTKNTTGHSHPHKEAYYFIDGIGVMEIGGKPRTVVKGDFVEINGGEFHKVFNTGATPLLFVCSWVKDESKSEA